MKHALLSASASHRWLNCPPSARLESKYPDQTSVYAQEGTLAHAYAENELRYSFRQIKLEEYHHKKKELQENVMFNSELYENIEMYKQTIEHLFLKFRTEGTFICIEQRVNLNKILPEGFGTCDCLIKSGDTLIICDLKYGQGVTVEAKDNPQLKLYALGCLENETKIITVIIQPRLNVVSSWEYTSEELKAWGESIQPTVLQAYKGEGEYQIGEHCRFCKHKLRCVKQMEEAFKNCETPEPKDLTSEEIKELLDKKPIIEDYLKSIEKYALEKVRDYGENIPGYKLVQSRTLRKYSSAEDVINALIKAECPENCFKPKEPISIGQMEKVLGKARFNEILGNFVIKPEGEPVLVPDSDKREEIDNLSVEDAFKNIGE